MDVLTSGKLYINGPKTYICTLGSFTSVVKKYPRNLLFLYPCLVQLLIAKGDHCHNSFVSFNGRLWDSLPVSVSPLSLRPSSITVYQDISLTTLITLFESYLSSFREDHRIEKVSYCLSHCLHPML